MNRDEKVATIEELVIRGNNALNSGRLTEALEWYDTAREADPMSPTVLYNRGLCLQKLGKNSEAEEEYRRVLSLAPDCAEAHTNLGNLLALGGCLSESLEHYRAAAAIDPGSGAVLNNLGNAHAEAGDLVSAIDLFRKALEIEPFDPLTRSNLIMTLEYSPETDRDSLFKEARAYQDSLCAGLPRRFNHKNIPDPERRLRIGYVSPDLKRHPVGFHLLPALSHHDKSLYEVFCYSDTLKTDELTEELRACADEWREIVGRTDEEVEKEILCDGIDILVDLTGHTAFNRLLLFARKPAPVQATWLGYFNTTGLKAMDYVISDATTIPPGEEDWFTETVVRLPDSRFCYAPPSFAPPVAPLPSLVNGYITFGSFNTILKVTDEVVELWSRVLHAVPASRLLLKARSFDSTETMDRYRELFARNGIGGERLDLRGSSNHPAMLMEYSEMDIALDPFPFSGGLTSCEALWMGVPVITLPGNTPISRQTRGFLRVLKMQELVARSAEQYVAVAKELASDLGRLSRMRSGLRARMAASPLCDGELFARHLEQAFREMWQKWCVARSGEVCIQLSANVSPARASSPAAQAESRTQRDERRLCIGGEVKAAGWEILSPVAGPQVDHVSDGRRLDVFKDAAFDILYAPHVLGRYDYRHELSDVLREWLRVLKPGGSLCISVPDLEILSRMLIDAEYGLSSEERFRVMQMIFGCHADPHDYNQSGFTFEILSDYLSRAGFTTIRRVSSFGFFDDASVMVFHGLPISLNVRADKPLADQSECEALCDEAARLTSAGDMEKGERVFFSVLQRFPDYPRALHALGVIAFRRGDSERALELISRAVSVKPDFSGAWNNLGNVYMALDKFDEAAEAYRRALDSDPGLNVSRRNLGLVYAKQGKPDVAISLLEEAVACDSGFAEAHGDLGALLLRQGRTVQAKEILERAVFLIPDWPECHYNLGIALRDLSRTGEAIEQYRRAVELRPGYSEAWGNLASALASEGRQQEALSCYRRAMACGNGTADTHSGYLMFLNSVPGVTQAEIFTESREWERKYALAVKEQFDFSERSTDPGRKLKIGFVSPDFCRHPVTCFFEPLVRNLDRTRFGLFCYADVLNRDEVTARIQGLADGWYETTGLQDEQVAERVVQDEIDILVDLAGHTAGGRLLLFARKSAPVQATWLGYFNTTGLGAIDYLISDFTTIMPGDEKWFAETVLRLPDSRFCYQPPSFAPEVRPAPAFRNGRVTFGSFNAIRKVGEEVVALWSRVLQAVPGSRLVLKSAAFSSEETVSFYRKLFSRYGIDAERLELRKASHHHAMLEEYGDIDIALDPLPYSGGLTSCEALWMGVPVVTMTGCLPISRQTHGFLRVMDMEELVASTPDQYVAIAASLASDSERLAGMRYGLRSRMAASPLCDGERFARAMENLLRQMWGKWCGGLEDVVSETSVSESKQIHVVNDVGGMTETTESAQEFFESCQKVSNGRYSSERHASGSFAMERGDYAAAETLFREALEAAPPTAALLNDLGVVLMRQGQTEEAVALFQQSIGVDQDNAHAYHNLGKSFYELGRFGEALVSLTTAVAMQEGNAEWFLSLGNTLNKVGKVSDALRCYRKAFRLDPRNVWAAVNQGNLYLRVGDVVQGRRMLEKAAGLVDAGSESHAGILMGLCYLDNIEESRIYEESRKWGDALLGRLPFYERPTLRPEVPGKRIRIGYVSPDFREHSVAFFLEKVLAGHSRERFQVFCYSNVKSEDHVTERFRSHADFWRSISAMDDEAVERAIRCDGIDILVDLAGHTEGNRLGVLARRPSPVQLTWLGYPATTGLRTMDYRLTDVVADPEGPSDLYHAELLWRMPGGFLCYAPPAESPTPVPPPCRTGKGVTFGSFNNPSKLSPATLRCWAGILEKVPDSTLLLKIYSSTDDAMRGKWMKVLSSHGIDISRVEILPRVSGMADHLALYGRVDIALDPFPYNGTTTTCEALWMGVPVVALSGDRHSGRVGASILKTVGCPELVAGNLDEYGEIAVRLAADISRMEAYRGRLRPMVESSPLCDGAGFVSMLEQAYLGMVEAVRAGEALRESVGGRDRDRARALVAIAQGQMRAMNLEKAESTCRKALALDPECKEALTLLGCVFVDSGRYGDGLRAFRDVLDLDPGYASARSNLLLAMHYSPFFTARRILKESIEWQKNHIAQPNTRRFRFDFSSGDGERIRVGYLSSDLRTHSVAYFFAPLLEFHDRKRFEITCYASVDKPDRVTDQLKLMSEHWRDVASLDTTELAEQIHADGIQILVDLAGHTGRQNRLPVFALRPAPVQVTWLGYPGTTGLDAMDYRLTDALSDPSESKSLYSERLVRLHDGFLCYRPPDEAPAVGPLPYLRNGYVTFASFNKLAKITDQVVALWARILQVVEGSRLIVKSHFCADAATCRRLMAKFESYGAPVERIELKPAEATTSQHLDMYNEVDIALDTFPYNGTTTTCEALWMGVPVVTLSGDRHSGRVGASILTSLGQENFIARSHEEYLTVCRNLASDIDTLGDLRDSLRPRMRSSVLCDGKNFARRVERAFRAMWRNRLNKFERSTDSC